MAAEIALGQPDVIYTWSSGGARAAAGATSTAPIVVAPAAEATMAALVPDFADPLPQCHRSDDKQPSAAREVSATAQGGGARRYPDRPAAQPSQSALAELSGRACRRRAISRPRADPNGGAGTRGTWTGHSPPRRPNASRAVFALSETTLVSSEEGLARIVELLNRPATARRFRTRRTSRPAVA